MKRTEPRFVVCVKNKGYVASLDLRKICQVVSDETTKKLRHIRVIDESGEDYFDPKGYFVEVQLPQSAERAVRRAAKRPRLVQAYPLNGERKREKASPLCTRRSLR